MSKAPLHRHAKEVLEVSQEPGAGPPAALMSTLVAGSSNLGLSDGAEGSHKARHKVERDRTMARHSSDNGGAHHVVKCCGARH